MSDPAARPFHSLIEVGQLTRLLILAASAALYFLIAKLSLALASVNPSATPIWPPTGFALAGALLFGPRIWPAIFLGAFFTNAMTAGTLLTSLMIAFGNTSEALLGAWLTKRVAQGVHAFDTPTGITKFFAILCAVATPVSATIGVFTLIFAGLATPEHFSEIWMTWWLGDLAGGIVITPVLVLWALHWRSSSAMLRAFSEPVLIFLGSAGVGFLVFSPVMPEVSRGPLAFLIVAPLMWAALRQGPKETASVALILSIFAVWGTAIGSSPLSRGNFNDEFLLLIAFLISVTMPSLVLSAEVSQRRKEERALRLHEMAQRHEVQRALENAREQLAQSQKMEAIGQLTGGIAHDFNNLMMVVSGYAQLLRLQVSDDKSLKALDSIKQAVQRGETLTRQLLTFSRKRSLRPAVIDLRTQLENLGSMIRSSLRGDIELKFDIEPNIWPIEIDFAEFELAMLNITLNARDAMPQGGKLHIYARNNHFYEAPMGTNIVGDYVSIAIRDTGTGIDPASLSKIFEPFFTTKEEGQGTGLGLSQVYGFVHQSGGAVSAENAPHRGAVITMYFPRSRAMPRQETPSANQSEDVAEGLRVLLVEDNSEVGDVTASLLAQLGCYVHRAETAPAALGFLQGSEDMDCVLADIVMPGGMNGIALAHEIRKIYPQTTVFLMTGYTNITTTAQNEFTILHKPFEIEALRAALAKAQAQS